MSESKDEWVGVKSQTDGKLILVRFKSGALTSILTRRYNKAITVCWDYACENDSGVPPMGVGEAMVVFENAMVPALEAGDLCLFVSIALFDGRKEWLAYTSDVQTTCHRLNAALAKYPRFPVAICCQDDPEGKLCMAIAERFGNGADI